MSSTKISTTVCLERELVLAVEAEAKLQHRSRSSMFEEIVRSHYKLPMGSSVPEEKPDGAQGNKTTVNPVPG